MKDLADEISSQGYAIRPMLTPASCADMVALYESDDHFRSRVVMARHGYGRGEYKYFSYPLPDPVSRLRATLYPPLALLANEWAAMLGQDQRFPATLATWTAQCHAGRQTRPTPLLLRYGPGDYNCLHQDLYGPLVFPFQVAILLNEPGRDFTGGEFLLVEQRPRMQSRAQVVTLRQGDGVVFPVHHRPVRGQRGFYRTVMRHGVSVVHSGQRHTLGVIFHDAA